MSENNVKKGSHFTQYESGECSKWPAHTVELPGLGEIPGKLFLNDILGLTSCEVSINSMAPSASMPISHQHQQNEEVYVFVQGKGEVQIDNEVIKVKEGSIVRIAPNGERTWRNNSSMPLVYIIIQAKEGSLAQFGLGDATVLEKEIIWDVA